MKVEKSIPTVTASSDNQDGQVREGSEQEAEQAFESVPTHQNIDQHVEQMQLWLDDSAEDLRNLVLVLIADPRSKPHELHNFDAETLESTIKLATKYKHSDLRDWAIQQLDQLKTTKAMEALCMQDEPITEEEASKLGYPLLLKIVAQREKNQYDKGRRAGMSQSPSSTNNSANATGSTAMSKTIPASEGLPALPKLSLSSPRALQPELPPCP